MSQPHGSGGYCILTSGHTLSFQVLFSRLCIGWVRQCKCELRFPSHLQAQHSMPASRLSEHYHQILCHCDICRCAGPCCGGAGIADNSRSDARICHARRRGRQRAQQQRLSLCSLSKPVLRQVQSASSTSSQLCAMQSSCEHSTWHDAGVTKLLEENSSHKSDLVPVTCSSSKFSSSPCNSRHY